MVLLQHIGCYYLKHHHQHEWKILDEGVCQEIITAQGETEYGIYLETCPNPVFPVHISTGGALCIYVSGT